MQIFRALFYRGRLSASQIAGNVKSAVLALNNQGTLPERQCCDMSSGESDSEDFVGLIGDSIAGAAEPTFWKDMVLDGAAGWTKSDMAINGSTSASCLASGEWCAGPMYRPKAQKNLIVFFAGGNDILNGATPEEAFRITAETVGTAKARGFTVFIATLLPRMNSGFDRRRDEFNALVRSQWKGISDGTVDLASDPETGADGKASTKELFPDGVHPSAATNYNNMSPYFQRRINRFYGSHGWIDAAKYYHRAQEAVPATGCSESANTVTVTSALNPPVGSTVRWKGAKPDEYNSKSAGWWVLTSGSDHFTFYHPKSGLGACTLPGKVSVALQRDADGWQVLDFGNGDYTLESCIGLTGEPIHIRNVNSNASTIVPWDDETIDGRSTITIPPRSTMTFMPVFLGPETSGCKWVRVP
jgi:lysophospholipase L1-like esterase